jgi:hypothetical protein
VIRPHRSLVAHLRVGLAERRRGREVTCQPRAGQATRLHLPPVEDVRREPRQRNQQPAEEVTQVLVVDQAVAHGGDRDQPAMACSRCAVTVVRTVGVQHQTGRLLPGDELRPGDPHGGPTSVPVPVLGEGAGKCVPELAQRPVDAPLRQPWNEHDAQVERRDGAVGPRLGLVQPPSRVPQVVACRVQGIPTAREIRAPFEPATEYRRRVRRSSRATVAASRVCPRRC